MKKILLLALSVVMALSCTDAAHALEISAAAYALADGETGRILLSEHGDEPLPMASTTKIMTALIAIENGDLNEVVTIPAEAQGVEGSSIYLQAGETLTLRELLLGLMLHSGNDAAVAIAVHIGGSVEGFCRLMNAKARELGANSTNFMNPNGLPHEEHYTTAEDLAIIAAAAMRNQQFREIVSTMDAVIPNDAQPWDRALTNKNKLLYQYQGANGIKTGYTKAAGRCLVGGALAEGLQLITVVLNCQDMYNETAELLDHGYEQYERVCVVSEALPVKIIEVEGSPMSQLEVFLPEGIYLTLNEEEKSQVRVETTLPDTIAAPVEAGRELGSVTVWLGEEKIKETALVCPVDIQAHEWIYYLKIVAGNWLHEG